MTPSTATLTFGPLLKHLRKQAGMTQRDLAAALGYSESLICNLEKAQRQPDLKAVTEQFVAALGLQGDPHTAAALIEQAALARGERPPASITFQRTIQTRIEEDRPANGRQLPSPPTELIGRAAEVNQLCNRLLGHSGRLLTLVGPPGIGKTTLALAVATRLQNHYQDGAIFVPLAAVSDATLLAATILTTVGSTDLNPPKDKLIAFLRRKTMLLVLDNLEQISAAAPLIAEVVTECPGLCILVTSRERLHLRAEQRYKVPPLDLAPAVELFVQRAQAVDDDFARTPRNQPTLEAICQRLDCLPLAIELCATQIDLLAPSQLLVKLQEHRLDLLVDGTRDLPPRQRTLRTAIGYSYALLNEAERILLRTLSVFVGGFALEQVAVLAIDRLEPDTVQATLHALIGKSLVRAETLPNGEQRFLLLETIREFALEQALAQGEEGALRQRHYAAYLQCFRTADSHLRGAEAATWVARVEPDQDNLRAALQWALDEARYNDAAWLMVAVHYLWFLRGSCYEGATWLVQLLPHRQTFAPNLRLATLIVFYATALELEEFPPVNRYRSEIIELLAVCSDKLLQASACYWLGWSATDVAQSIALLERCIGLVHAASEAPSQDAEFGAMTDRTFVLASALEVYAANLIDQGDVARAVPIATQSLALFRLRGNPYGIGNCLGILGRLALLQGELNQAQRLFHEVMAIATSFNLRPTQCEWQPLLGIVTLYGGDVREARKLFNEILPLCIELKSKFFLARVCRCLAELALWEGEVAQAEHWLAQNLNHQADPRRITVSQVTRLLLAARLAAAQRQYLRAATLFGLTDQVHSQIRYVIAGPMRSLADAALATVREALEPAIFAEAFAAGQQMSLEEAFATLLVLTPIATQEWVPIPA